MGEADTTHSHTDARTGPGAILEAMRPAHWIKNAFVAAPLLFSGLFSDPASWGLCLAAVGAFCLLGSAVYLINDICDREEDRLHPTKCRRPIPSGRLTPRAAAVAAAVLLIAAAAIVIVLAAVTPRRGKLLGGHALLVWCAAYVALNLLYSFWLKRKAFVDVLVVAFGFVLRAMAGAAAIAVPVSPWLVVCTLSLCLFIAVTKRRGEVAEGPDGQARASRRVNRVYDARQLDFLLTVSAAMAILTYTISCLAPQTIRRIGSAHMVWTVPVVVYGMFRYHRITRNVGGSDPVGRLVRDRVMWIVLAIYVVMSGLIVKFGAHPAVRDILLVD
jgi:4-hydroxybenzoate polyprenyltransferase